MTANARDVMTALLALDVYNRGANPKLAEKTGDELSDLVGTAHLIPTSADGHS